MRWSRTADGGGYIYSFNGPHSLFVRYHPVAARAGGQPSAGACADGRKRPAHLAARSADAACRSHGALLGLLRRRARRLRRSRAHRAREHLQHATMAITAARTRSRATRRSAHGREGWRGRCAGSPNNWNSSPRCEDPNRRIEADHAAGPREATCDFYIDELACGRHSLLGHRRAATATSGRLGIEGLSDPFNPYEPVDSSAAAIAAQGLLRLGRYLKNEALLAGGPDGLRRAVRRAVSEHGPRAPGADPARGLSSAERLGPRARGGRRAARRGLHVGRLSRAGVGALPASYD